MLGISLLPSTYNRAVPVNLLDSQHAIMQMTESSGPSSSVSALKTNGVTPRSIGLVNVVANASAGKDANGVDEDEHTPLENLLAVSETVVRQAIDFVRDDLSSDDQLTFRSKYIPGSTIGES